MPGVAQRKNETGKIEEKMILIPRGGKGRDHGFLTPFSNPPTQSSQI
jgi:hypothetical protein